MKPQATRSIQPAEPTENQGESYASASFTIRREWIIRGDHREPSRGGNKPQSAALAVPSGRGTRLCPPSLVTSITAKRPARLAQRPRDWKPPQMLVPEVSSWPDPLHTAFPALAH